jgi:hypothetical protein
MKESTIIQLARSVCGTAILITHMVTGANSTFVILGVVLLGLPLELLQHVKASTSS